jgi:hypothetical protein
VLFTSKSLGQTYEVPTNYQFKSKEDFASYEPQIIQTAIWLESTPIDKEAAKRQQANAFLIKWLEGSPNVTIEIQAYVMDLAKENAEFLAVFMGGWTKYKLQNIDKNDKLKLNLEGVKSVIKLYSLGGAKKNKAIEKLAKMNDKELEEWVSKKM